MSASISMFQINPAWLFASFVTMAASAIGLLSVWAGLGRGHWFLRLAAGGAVLALGTFIPAYDLILLFFTQAAVVLIALFLFRGICGRGEHQTGDPSSMAAAHRARFALADLFLAIAVAGGVLAASAKVPKDVWADGLRLAILGASLGAVTLAAAWAGLGRGHLLIRIAITCTVAACAGVIWNRPMTNGVFIFGPPDRPGWWSGLMAVTGGVMILQLLLVRVSRRATSRWPGDQPSGKPVGLFVVRIGQVVLGTMIVLPPGYTWYRLVTPVPIPDTPLPSPNAYDELVELATSIDRAEAAAVPREAPVEVLRPFVAKYGPVLDRARPALAREWAVPVDYRSLDYVERALRLRPLCLALAAEGGLAAQEGDTPGGARSYLSCVQLGCGTARGGAVIDWLVGAAFEGIGISGLSKVRHRLSAADCRELAQTLAAIDASREPLDNILTRERAWSQHGLGWPGRLQTLFDDLTGESHERQILYETKPYRRCQASMRLLICDLNVRAFQLEQGELPGDLSELVPEYLPSLPDDPYSGAPLVYRVQGDGHVLYSIGHNRQDDGGRADFDDGDIALGMYDTPASSPTDP